MILRSMYPLRLCSGYLTVIILITIKFIFLNKFYKPFFILAIPFKIQKSSFRLAVISRCCNYRNFRRSSTFACSLFASNSTKGENELIGSTPSWCIAIIHTLALRKRIQKREVWDHVATLRLAGHFLCFPFSSSF